MLKIKKQILRLFNYSEVDTGKRNSLNELALNLVKIHSKPNIIFKEMLKHIERKRWVLPVYSFMQDLIGSAMSYEQKRLSKGLDRLLSKKTKRYLDKLLTTEEDIYNITKLQADAKSFNCRSVKTEIEKKIRVNSIYISAKRSLPKLKISKANIAYYASLVDYHNVGMIMRMPKGIKHLYLLCYVFHRSQKIEDNLITSYVYKVSKTLEEAKVYGKKEFMQSSKEVVYDKEKLGIILGYFCENNLQRFKFRTVSKRAFKIMPKDIVLKVSKLLQNRAKRERSYRWDYCELKKRSISMNIKPLLMAIEFDCAEASHPIIEAATYLKNYFVTNKPLSQCDINKLPRKCIPKSMEGYLNDDGRINPYKYAFFVYYRIMKLIINNKIYVNDSLSFKDFSEDIKVTQDWHKNKDMILKKLALPKLSMPLSDRLKELEKKLEESYIRTNTRIRSGENKEVTVKPDGSWTIRYPKNTDEEFDPPFFRKLNKVTINNIFDVVEDECNFMKAFEHHLARYNKKEAPYQLLKACIIANGTWQGNYNMAARSNLDFESLQRVFKARLRVKTLKSACDIITQAIAKQGHFKLRNTCNYGYHGSIDGSKHLTKKQTIQARYSSKYFGMQRGIVSLNMVVNEVPVNCDIIGANEYEGHHIYDLYHGNTSNIDPGILSTDTAGSNLINFLILDNIDVDYAPAYKSIVNRSNGLVGFKEVNQYKDFTIRPCSVVPTKMIENHESEIKQILSSLYLNETEQHVIVRKLCCRERQTNLKKALWAYNDILFSIHMLKYIDDPEYKRCVRKALNRGEGYNRLFNAVVNVGNKKIRGLCEEETQIWNHCTRLLTLITIYYNSYILSQVIDERLAKGDEKGANLLVKASPMASRHINLSGNYYYSDEDKRLDLEEIKQNLSSLLDDIL